MRKLRIAVNKNSTNITDALNDADDAVVAIPSHYLIMPPASSASSSAVATVPSTTLTTTTTISFATAPKNDNADSFFGTHFFFIIIIFAHYHGFIIVIINIINIIHTMDTKLPPRSHWRHPLAQLHSLHCMCRCRRRDDKYVGQYSDFGMCPGDIV